MHLVARQHHGLARGHAGDRLAVHLQVEGALKHVVEADHPLRLDHEGPTELGMHLADDSPRLGHFGLQVEAPSQPHHSQDVGKRVHRGEASFGGAVKIGGGSIIQPVGAEVYTLLDA
jgi:hypothetical protein